MNTLASALFRLHEGRAAAPEAPHVQRFISEALRILFPQFRAQPVLDANALEVDLRRLQIDLVELLHPLASRLPRSCDLLSADFLAALPQLQQALLEDATAIADGDPAAAGVEEVIAAYPGFYAIAVYRMANWLYRQQVPLLPRMFAEQAHMRTGIDIHPGATIGSHFCIDHGTGIVVGQTAHIGNHVKLYQGVTLGALSVEKDLAGQKRHPTLEDHVVIYAGATILGGSVVVGAHSIIGGNVWLTESVPPHSKVYHRGQIRINAGVAEYLEFHI